MQAIYYRGADGTEPVNAYLRALKGRREPNLKNQIARLNLLGPSEHLPIEYSKQVEGELRGARLPEAETAIARQRWRDFKARMDAKPRTPPRAAGHDAP